MNTLTTKIILGSIVISGALAAFPIEPFDMHNDLPHKIQEYMDAKQANASQDPRDWSLKNTHIIIEFEGSSRSSNDRETSNDVDTGNSQDCR